MIIKDPIEFFKRINDAVASINKTRQKGNEIIHEMGWVEYQTEDIPHGVRTAFQKQNEFAHQKEFRIIFKDPLDNEKPYYIGDISDIAVYGTYEGLIKE